MDTASNAGFFFIEDALHIHFQIKALFDQNFSTSHCNKKKELYYIKDVKNIYFA